MVRKLIGAFSLTAVMASGALAQQFQQTFTFVSGGPNPITYNYLGAFAAGGNNGMTGVGTSSFQIWCVDPLQFVSDGTQYPSAWVTPLNSPASAFGVTDAERSEANHNTAATGAAAELEYQKAAYLGLQMDADISHGGSISDAKAYQAAIWLVMGYTYSSGLAGWGLLGITSTDISNANAYITAMNNTSAYNTIATNDWAVISGPTSNQEFIYERQSSTFLQVTPEPGTMSLLALGLVGVAGSSIRRRRRGLAA